MNKLYCWIICIVVILNISMVTISSAENTDIWDGSISTTYGGGTGTKKDPYIISTASQLAYLVNGDNYYYDDTYFKLISDIYLNEKTDFTFDENGLVTGIDPTADINVWVVGSSIHNNVIIDGNNHTIYGLYSVESSNYVAISLFGQINRTIENLNIGFGYVKGNSRTNACAFGDLSRDAVLKNCTNYATISGYRKVAGISSDSVGTIDSCVNYGIISIAGEGEVATLAGICACNRGVVVDCINYGDLSNYCGVGGIVESNDGIIAGCVNYGSLYCVRNDCGGIAGSNSGIITSCLNNGSIRGGVGEDFYIGGRIGGISGSSDTSSVIENCVNAGTIETTLQYHGGGLIGAIYDNVIVENCITIGKYQGAVSEIVGSAIYNNYPNSTCYYAVDITGEGKYGEGKTLEQLNSDEFIHELNKFVENSQSQYIKYWVKGERIPKFAEYIDLVTITSSSNDGGNISPLGVKSVLKGYNASYTITPDYGYIIQDVLVNGTSVGNVTSYTLENVMANSTIDVRFKENGMVADSYAGGSGTETDPYRISTAPQLRRLTQQINKGVDTWYCYYVLTDDIILNTPDKFLYDINGKVTGPNPQNMPEEWLPIGSNDDNRYYLDGNSHTISGVYVNTPNESNVGFVKEAAEVHNIKLSYGYLCGNWDVAGIVSSADVVSNCENENVTVCATNGYAGGIAAWAAAYSCINKASVKGGSWSGGIVGSGSGTDCINYGDVSGRTIGGIAGSGGNLYECFNYGAVSGYYAGGFIGEASGNEIINCINYGEISGEKCGGFIGRVNTEYALINCLSVGKVTNGVADIFDNLNSSYVEFKNSYNVSSKTTVIGNYIKDISYDDYTDIKLICSFNKSIQKLNIPDLSFWMSDAITKEPKLTDIKDIFNIKINCLAGGTVTPYTNMALVSGSSVRINFVPDEGNIIHSIIVNGKEITPQSYYSVNSIKDDLDIEVFFSDSTGKIVTGFEEGTGSMENPFIISSPKHFEYMAQRVNDLQTDYDNYYFMLDDDVDMTGVKYTPIGCDTMYQFQGIFDGNSHTIKNLSFESSHDDFGLFGFIGTNAVISNLNLTNITLNSTHNRIGVVAGNNNGKISNCKVVSSNIQPNDGMKIGGLVGTNAGIIEHSVNEANIIDGNEYLGGISGENFGEIINCINKGDVKNTNYRGGMIGGICGFSSGGIRWCENTGRIVATGYYAADCGGIVGQGATGANFSDPLEAFGYVKDCINRGYVDGRCYVGGIVGSSSSLIWNCTNYGDVTSSEYGDSYNIGGIVGWGSGDGARHGIYKDINEPFVKECVNSGTISGARAVGGIIGEASTRVGLCFNYGKLLAKGNVGGIAGNLSELIINCGNYGDIYTEGIAGGIVAYNTGILINSYNRGNIEGGNDVGGIVGINRFANDYEHNFSIFNCYNSGKIFSEIGGSCIGFNAVDAYISSVYSLHGCASSTIYKSDEPTIADEVHQGEILELLNNSLKEYEPLEGEEAIVWALDEFGLPELIIAEDDVLNLEKITRSDNGYDFTVSVKFDQLALTESAKIIVALYENGKFINASYCNVNKFDAVKTLSIRSMQIVTNVKLFLWSDLNKMLPLCESKTINIE